MRVLKSLILGLMLLVFTVGAAAASDITPDLGSLDGTRYTNQYFGLQLTLPENWMASEAKFPYLVTIFKYPQGAKVQFNPSFLTIVEKTKGSSVTSGKEYLANVKKLLQDGKARYKLNDSLPPVVLGGVTFAVLEAEVSSESVTIKQRFYSAVIKDYALSFILTSSSDQGQEVKEMQKVLASIQFSKR